MDVLIEDSTHKKSYRIIARDESVALYEQSNDIVPTYILLGAHGRFKFSQVISEVSDKIALFSNISDEKSVIIKLDENGVFPNATALYQSVTQDDKIEICLCIETIHEDIYPIIKVEMSRIVDYTIVDGEGFALQHFTTDINKYRFMQKSY